MGLKKLTRIVLSSLIGSIAFALIPLALSSFLIFTHGINSPGSDFQYLEIIFLVIFLVGGVIGICVEYFQFNFYKSLAVSSCLGFISYLFLLPFTPAFYLTQKFTFAHALGITGGFLFYIFCGLIAGCVCGIFANRTKINWKNSIYQTYSWYLILSA